MNIRTCNKLISAGNEFLSRPWVIRSKDINFGAGGDVVGAGHTSGKSNASMISQCACAAYVAVAARVRVRFSCQQLRAVDPCSQIAPLSGCAGDAKQLCRMANSDLACSRARATRKL